MGSVARRQTIYEYKKKIILMFPVLIFVRGWINPWVPGHSPETQWFCDIRYRKSPLEYTSTITLCSSHKLSQFYIQNI
jgi:hypothetical protein